MFTRTDSRGNRFLFAEATHTFSDFSESTQVTLSPEEWRTVAYNALDRSEGVSFGRGSSQNPDRAEAYKYLEAMDDQSTSALIPGEYRIVVENASKNVVAVIDRGRTDEVDKGDPSSDSRGDWGKPNPYRPISGGKGEVLGGQGHRIALQLKPDSGTPDFSLSDSTMHMEGFKGDLQN